jgi:photosystem II stability/assembly factor-like uncharacterized protein
VYAASCSGGVYKSTDAGRTWYGTNGNLGTIQPYALATNGGLLFLATAEQGVYRSADGAASWQILPDFWGGKLVALEAHPTDPHTLYAGTNGCGVFRTGDDGASWVSLNMPGSPLVRDLAVAPFGDAIYVAAHDAGFWMSPDGGRHWTPMAGGLPPTVRAQTLLVAGSDGTPVLYGGTDTGLYRWSTGEAMWTTDGLGHSIFAVAQQSAVLYAGTQQGLWRR